MTGQIDYQAAEVDLVATRWEWDFRPTTWWMKALGGRNPIPIINVLRFRDGKIVEFWNHGRDIDTAAANLTEAARLKNSRRTALCSQEFTAPIRASPAIPKF